MSWKDLFGDEIENCVGTLHEESGFSVNEYAKGIELANAMADRLIKAETVALEREKFEAEQANKEKALRLEEERFEAEQANKEKALRLEEERFKAEQANKEKMLDLERDKLSVEQHSKSCDNLHSKETLLLDKDKLKAEKRDRLIKNILTGVTFVGGAAITIWGTIYSDNFDENRLRDKEAGRFHIRNWLGFLKH